MVTCRKQKIVAEAGVWSQFGYLLCGVMTSPKEAQQDVAQSKNKGVKCVRHSPRGGYTDDDVDQAKK
jgi:hypothetical protein